MRGSRCYFFLVVMLACLFLPGTSRAQGSERGSAGN